MEGINNININQNYDLINAFEILTNLQENIKKEILLNNLCKKFYYIILILYILTLNNTLINLNAF